MNRYGLKEPKGAGPLGFNPFEDEEEDGRFVPVPEAVKVDLPTPLGFNPFEEEAEAEPAPEAKGLKAPKEGGVISRSFKRGQFMVELSRLQTEQKAKIRAGEERDPEIDTRIAEIKRLTPDPRELKEEDLLTQMAGYTAEQVPIMGEVVKGGVEEGMRYAIYGGMTGAAVEGVAAAPGFAVGGRLGMMYGASREAYILEGGLAFDEFSELKDEKGNKIDPLLAVRAADIVGVVNAIIEMAQVRTILRTIPGGQKLLRWGINRTAKKALKYALKKRTKKQILATGGKTFATALGTEVGQEVLQEITNVVGEETIKEITNAVDNAEFKLARKDKEVLKKQINRIGAIGLQTLKAMPALVGPGVTVTTGMEMAQRPEAVLPTPKAPPPSPTAQPIDILDVVEAKDKKVVKAAVREAKKGTLNVDQLETIREQFAERYPDSTEIKNLDILIAQLSQVEVPGTAEGLVPVGVTGELARKSAEESAGIMDEALTQEEELRQSEEGARLLRDELAEEEAVSEEAMAGFERLPEEIEPEVFEEEEVEEGVAIEEGWDRLDINTEVQKAWRKEYGADATIDLIKQKQEGYEKPDIERALEYQEKARKQRQVEKEQAFSEEGKKEAEAIGRERAEAEKAVGRQFVEDYKTEYESLADAQILTIPHPEKTEGRLASVLVQKTDKKILFWQLDRKGQETRILGSIEEGAADVSSRNVLMGLRDGFYEIEKKAKIPRPGVKEIEQIPTIEEIDQAAAEAETEPTEAQKEAGIYKKGHIKLHGFDISIENPKGSMRSGVGPTGKKWEQELKHHYGYIRGTKGKDKDHLDVFIGPNPESNKVFVVDQTVPETGKFDEHKIMMGFPTVQQARVGYLANYERGWKGLGDITELTIDEFKEWTRGDTTKAIEEVARPEVKPIPEPKAIEYKTKIRVEETGEIVEVTMDAEQAIKDVDEKIVAYQKLIDCIG